MLARAAAFAVVSTVAGTAGVRDAAACSCAPATACLRWGRSTAVFVGEVVDVQRADWVETARIRVARVYKGIAPETSVVTLVSRYSSCSLEWRTGERWVVYADSGPQGLRSSLCSGSRQLDASAPLPDLRPEAGVVDGWLLRPRAEAGVEPWVEGAPVWIDAPSGRIASRTGARGSFRLTGVPEGIWTVAFDLGGRETATASATVASPDRCATVEALAEPAPR